MISIPAPQLERLAADTFVAAGSSGAEANRIAHYLVAANLTGHDSHGVVRIPRYLQMLKEGMVYADRKVEVVTETPVMAIVDGHYGYGQTVAPEAVAIGIRKCKEMGLSAVGLRNAGHIGRVADWAEMASAEGLVSVHFVNAAGSPLVAPFAGAERRFSTAPYCVGVPLSGRPPLLLDFATSIVAEGKVLVASQGGRPIPGDALIGLDGKTSDDPHLLYGDYEKIGRRDIRNGTGALRAFGEHKGSGLALMCELLGGALTGNGAVMPGRRFANGMFSFYIDPARIDPEGLFPKEVQRYVAFVKAGKAAAPGAEILLPGEPEQRTRAERLAEGVPLSEETWTLLLSAARGIGVDVAPYERLSPTHA
jgi:uncharacterized oxidoreductase